MSLVASIEGTLEGRSSDSVLVRLGGITLQIFVPGHDLAGLPQTGEHIRLLTYLAVREDDIQLYGFGSRQGRILFEAMLGVSGVGPRAALAVLSVLSPEDLAGAIVTGDAGAISRAQGVGKRTADRIILELKGKIEEELSALAVGAVGPAAGTGPGDPALQWLLGLGFSAPEGRQALSVEREDGLGTEERVRRALQRMGRSGG